MQGDSLAKRLGVPGVESPTVRGSPIGITLFRRTETRFVNEWLRKANGE
jgi:hypothetical protein